MENKKLSKEQFQNKLEKSLYKAVRRYLNTKDDTNEIVQDVIDPNYVAEVDPDEVKDPKKVNIMNKSLKSQEDVAKGVDKLKIFINSKRTKN